MRGCKKREDTSLSLLNLSPSYIKPQFPAVNFFITLELKGRGGLFTPLPDEFIHLKWGFVSWELAHCTCTLLMFQEAGFTSEPFRVRVKQKLYTQSCVRERERRRKREDVSRSILVTLPLWHSLCRELDCKIENTGLRWKWWKCLFKMKRLLLGGIYITYNLPSYPLWGPLKSAKHANIAVKLNLICRQIKPFLRVLPLSFICFWAKETHGTFKCTWL